MLGLVELLLGWFASLVKSRRRLRAENLVLRHQLNILRRRAARRVRLSDVDRLVFVWLYRLCPAVAQAVTIVKPETIIGWHRRGYRAFWRWKSRSKGGRPPVPREIRDLIFRMVAENPTWRRAPRIHGELVMLGFDVSERSVSRWMRRAPRPYESGQRWLAFLRNHREAIAAMDFFSVPTFTFNVLYVFFLIGHDRRRILRFNVTRHPTSVWIVQELREAFPYEPNTKFLLLDHDAKYCSEVPNVIRSMNIHPARTAVGCPWQDGVAERWVWPGLTSDLPSN